MNTTKNPKAIALATDLFYSGKVHATVVDVDERALRPRTRVLIDVKGVILEFVYQPDQQVPNIGDELTSNILNT